MNLLSLVLLMLLLAAVACVPADAADSPLSGPIKDWVVIGPFPNPERAADSKDRGAFDVDYLTSLGGESKARIKPGTVVESAQAKQVRLTGSVLDFRAHFPASDHKLAYAYTELTMPSNQEAFLFLGSDDGAKVWINGKLVFEVLLGRPCIEREDHFTANLRKGTNTILVKVENGTGDWALALEALSGEAARKVQAEIKLESDLREFQNQELAPVGWPSYVFWPDPAHAPRIVWRDAERVQELVGKMPVKVRWFDSGLNEVSKLDTPGRYAAWIEARMPDGTPLRRSIAFCCISGDLIPWWSDWGLDVPYLGKPIDKEAWNERSGVVSRCAGRLYREALMTTEAGAVFLAGMCEAKPAGSVCSVTESPEVANDDFQLALKLKLLKLDGKARPLAPPKSRSATPAPVIRQGTPQEAGVSTDAKEKIDAVCRQWAEESGEPISVLVARHGVIVTHAAFGKDSDGKPLTTDFRSELASITKAISGMLFSRFLDQGYVTLDEPIGNRLPGFPVKGGKTLTYRHLFTHTSGLAGHGEWGGLHNPHLENVILNGLPYLKPGAKHMYNGMGYDLAGKAMEAMTGTSIIRLFHDGLYRPMGIPDVPMSDMGYSARMTSLELGMIGQWLANHGSYGDKEFISDETFRKLLPERLSKYYPGIDVDWGIGLTWYHETKEGAPANSMNPKDLILGEHVIGHGSATSCILRVDLDNDLVIAQVRRTAGPKYGEHLTKFLQAVADSLR